MSDMKFVKYIPLPEDIYRVRIADVKVQQNKETKEEFNSWDLEVIDEGSEYLGKHFSFAASKSFGPKSKTYAFLRAAGLEALEAEADLNTDDFIGQELYVKVLLTTKKGTDEPVNKIDIFWSVEEFVKLAEKASRINKVGAAKIVGKPTVAQPAAKPAVAVGKPAVAGAKSTGPAKVSPRQQVAQAEPPSSEEEAGEGLGDFPQ